MLSGIFDGEDIHAARDLTTIESIPSHYDRDILGVGRRRRGGLNEHPTDPEIQRAPDSGRFWTSYIALTIKIRWNGSRLEHFAHEL